MPNPNVGLHAANATMCDPGYYLENGECLDCGSGYYCIHGTPYSCPENYPNSTAGSMGPNDCYLTTSVGKYVRVAGGGQEPCPAGSYCPGGTKVYFSPYVFVDYITTSGDASINTKLHLSITGYKVKTRMALNDQSRIFGRYYGVVNDVYQRYYVGMVTQLPYRFETAWFDNYLQVHDYEPFVDGRVHDYDIVFTNGTQTMDVDGGRVMANSGTVDPGKIATQYLISAARNATVYDMQWYDAMTDELLRHFIPAYDTETQAYGMYDTVSHTFFGNGKWDEWTYGIGDEPSDGPGTITGPTVDFATQNTPMTGGRDVCPPNSSSNTGASVCTCHAGYGMYQKSCRQLCVGGNTLKSSMGLNIPIYQEQLTHPAIGVQLGTNPTACYIPLDPGTANKALHIKIGDAIYHTIE